jgi:thiol:disulfide interchange protein
VKFSVALGAAAATLMAIASPVAAAQTGSFNEKILAQAQAQGRPVLVEVYADWCSVCKVQHKHISELVRDPAFKNLVVLRLNYDTQKAERRKLNVPRQSTLIAFNGRKETGRVVAVTDRGAIHALLQSTL